MLACLPGLLLASHPTSFYQAKKHAAAVYQGHESTFYCGCNYQGKNIDPNACGYTPRKQAKRGKRLEWEHVVPAWEVGHQRQCWQQGGRKNCNKTDKAFVMMTSDLHNLVPSVGELNGDRSNFRYGMVLSNAKNYGQCDFKVDFTARRVEPKADKKGDVARIYFYMRDRYGLSISRQQTQLFQAWDKTDPPDAQERQRDQRIAAIQGNSNCYVSKTCAIEETQIVTAKPAKLIASNASCLPEKRFCYQMTSCDEAKHYLTACGLITLDRNNDGVPCESLCN